MNDFRSAAHFDPSRYRLFSACIFVDIYKRAMHCSKKTVCLLGSVDRMSTVQHRRGLGKDLRQFAVVCLLR
jgi:hypothetical protein